jgi:hypothetical protein
VRTVMMSILAFAKLSVGIVRETLIADVAIDNTIATNRLQSVAV